MPSTAIYDWGRAVRGNKELTPSFRLVAEAIADHINRRTNVAWPSASRIAAMAAVCVRTVRRAIAALERLGIITVNRRTGLSSLFGYGGTAGVTHDKMSRVSSAGSDRSARRSAPATTPATPAKMSRVPVTKCHPTPDSSVRGGGDTAVTLTSKERECLKNDGVAVPATRRRVTATPIGRGAPVTTPTPTAHSPTTDDKGQPIISGAQWAEMRRMMKGIGAAPDAVSAAAPVTNATPTPTPAKMSRVPSAQRPPLMTLSDIEADPTLVQTHKPTQREIMTAALKMKRGY